MEFLKKLNKTGYNKNIEELKNIQLKKNNKFNKFYEIIDKKIKYDNKYLKKLRSLKILVNDLYKDNSDSLNNVFKVYLDEISIQIQHLSILNENYEINIINKIKPEIVKYINTNTLIMDNLFNLEDEFSGYDDKFKDHLFKFNNNINKDIIDFSKEFKEKFIKINWLKNKLLKSLKNLDKTLLNTISKNKIELNIHIVSYIKNFEFEYQEILKLSNSVRDIKHTIDDLVIDLPHKEIFNSIDYLLDNSKLYNYLKILINNNKEISFKFLYDKNSINNYILDLDNFTKENHKDISLIETFFNSLKFVLSNILKDLYESNRYKDLSDIIFIIQHFKFIDGFLKEFMQNCWFLAQEEVLNHLLINRNNNNSDLNKKYILVNIISISEILKIECLKIINKIAPYLVEEQNFKYYYNLKNYMEKKYKIYIFNNELFSQSNIKIFN